MNHTVLPYSCTWLGIASPPIISQTTADSQLSPSSSHKQHGLFRSLSTVALADGLLSFPTAAAQRGVCPYFLKTRKNLGWFQANYLKFELGILAYMYISVSKTQ